MKNFKLLSMLLAATSLLLASCSIDNFDYAQSGEECVVTLSAQIPSTVGSRADVLPGGAAEVTKLSYWVYKVEGGTWTHLPALSGVEEVVNSVATIPLTLMKSLEYKVVLWADAFGDGANSPYSYNTSTCKITMDFDKISANNEQLDAFYGVKGLETTTVNPQIDLTRPFAQLNIGTSDLDKAADHGVTISTTGIKLECANVLNLRTGEVSGEQTRVYTSAALPSGYDFPFSADKYDYISLNYILVGTVSVATPVELSYNIGSKVCTLEINAPLQRNCRTNVYGSILSSNTELGIGFGGFGDDNSTDLDDNDENDIEEDITVGGGDFNPDGGDL